MILDPDSLTRTEIRRIFRSHRGAATQLARDLAVGTGKSVESYQAAISRWLRGKTTSALIDAAARKLAAKLVSTSQKRASR